MLKFRKKYLNPLTSRNCQKVQNESDLFPARASPSLITIQFEALVISLSDMVQRCFNVLYTIRVKGLTILKFLFYHWIDSRRDLVNWKRLLFPFVFHTHPRNTSSFFVSIKAISSSSTFCACVLYSLNHVTVPSRSQISTNRMS